MVSVLHKNINRGYSLELLLNEPRREKTGFCICENKDADQLHGNREAGQRLCFRYTDSTILLLPTFEILSLWPHSVAVQTCLCRTWLETPKTGFLTSRLKYRDKALLLSTCIMFYGEISIRNLFYHIRPTLNEPRCEKTGLQGFQPRPTQTGLYSHRRWLEA